MERYKNTDLFTRGSYLYGGSIALIISWTLTTLLSGCRFGNYTSSTPSPTPDPFSGYYDTRADTLQFCASTPQEKCVSAASTEVPSLISAEMTSPVALIMQNLATGAAALTAYTGGQTALSINVNPDKTLSYNAQYAPDPLFLDPGCTSFQTLEEQGALLSGPPNPVPGSGHSTLGRVQLLIRVTTNIREQTIGTCPTTLQAMSDCYQDITRCGGTTPAGNQQLQAQVQAIFNPYINTGAMTASDIAHATTLAYEIQYQ